MSYAHDEMLVQNAQNQNKNKRKCSKRLRNIIQVVRKSSPHPMEQFSNRVDTKKAKKYIVKYPNCFSKCLQIFSFSSFRRHLWIFEKSMNSLPLSRYRIPSFHRLRISTGSFLSTKPSFNTGRNSARS